jgi:hypothetical protein
VILDTNALSAMADGDPDLEPMLRLAGIVAATGQSTKDAWRL